MTFKRKMDKGQRFYINNMEFVCMEVHAYLQTRVDGEKSDCLLYTSPSPRDRTRSRMPSSA